jgi:arsenate reductase
VSVGLGFAVFFAFWARVGLGRRWVPAQPLAAEGRHSALSASTTPGERVHPEVVEVMRELGIDLSARVLQALTTELAQQADVVVTMGCGYACPYIPGKGYVDWELPDPEGRPIEEVVTTRDDIQQRVSALVVELDKAT